MTRGAATRHLARLGDVLGALHKGERDPVDADIERALEIGAVFLGQRRDRQQRVGKADAFAVGDVPPTSTRVAACCSVDLSTRRRACRRRSDGVAVFQGAERFPGAAGQCALAVAGALSRVEHEGGARQQLRLVARKGSDAQLRSLKVGEDADGAAELASRRADAATRSRSASRLVWLMLMRNRSAPASKRLANRSRGLGDAGPSVARILTRLNVHRNSAGRLVSVSCTVQLFCSPVSTSKKPLRSKPLARQLSSPRMENSLSLVHMNAFPAHSPPRS